MKLLVFLGGEFDWTSCADASYLQDLLINYLETHGGEYFNTPPNVVISLPGKHHPNWLVTCSLTKQRVTNADVTNFRAAGYGPDFINTLQTYILNGQNLTLLAVVLDVKQGN